MHSISSLLDKKPSGEDLSRCCFLIFPLPDYRPRGILFSPMNLLLLSIWGRTFPLGGARGRLHFRVEAFLFAGYFFAMVSFHLAALWTLSLRLRPPLSYHALGDFPRGELGWSAGFQDSFGVGQRFFSLFIALIWVLRNVIASTSPPRIYRSKPISSFPPKGDPSHSPPSETTFKLPSSEPLRAERKAAA